MTAKPKIKSLFGTGLYGTQNLNTVFQALAGIQLPPIARAQNPFTNHPWIFAAATAIATSASQAPFTVFRETDDTQRRRRELFSKTYDQIWVPRRGRSRRAIQRYSQIPSEKRHVQKALDADYDHPLADVLLNPNPYQKGGQLFWSSILWIALRGHCFWVLENADSESVAPGQLPDKIWPLSPDLFEPVLRYGTHGELVAWKFRPPQELDKRAQGVSIRLELDEVIEFKVPHPTSFLHGLSKLAVTAYGVAQDLALKEHNRSIVENRGDPGGVVMYDAVMEEEERRAWLRQWENRHKGSGNSRKTALLDAGFKYMPIGLSPAEMEGRSQLEWNRSEHLAVMGTPPSVLGVTEFVNYATDLGQKRNFWDHTILPILRLVEETLDATLFFDTPDNVVGLFDLRNVEALRAGLTEKIEAAKLLCGAELHANPEAAFEVVGLEVPNYDGINTPAFGAEPPPEPVVAPPAQPDPAPVPEPVGEQAGSRAPYVRTRKAATRADEFAEVQEPLEKKFGGRYLRWINGERRITLERFDAAVSAHLRPHGASSKVGPGTVDLTDIIPSLVDSQSRMKTRIRPLFSELLNTTFDFTLTDLGDIPVFGIDAPSILRVFEHREQHILTGTPVTVRNNLLRSLSDGIAAGEPIGQLRLRVAETYNIAASSHRTLMIARTETAGFMNETRDAMFEEQGFEEESWSTSNDEAVRDHHKTFGLAGTQKRGFNYLTLVGVSGRLEFPGDSRAPAGEVINCRCVKIPEK